MKAPIIVTVSPNEISGNALSDQLNPLITESNGGMKLLSYTTESVGTNFDGLASLVILNLPIWSLHHISHIQRIKARGYAGQILTLVGNLKSWNAAIECSSALRQVKPLEIPVETANLLGFVRRLLRKTDSEYRAAPRFETNLRGSIDSLESTYSCSIKNVSRGGACLRLEGDIPLVQGDAITLNLKLTDRPTTQSIEGKVAWIKPSIALIGFQFATATDL